MSKKTWMPLYVADYLADTMHLSAEEHGAYLLLIMHAWLNNGELPVDDERLRRITKMDAKSWKVSWSEVSRFFYKDGDFYRHKRIEKELQRADDIIDKRSQAGKASAAKRKAQQTLNTISTHVQQKCEQRWQQTPIPSPSQSHIEDNSLRSLSSPAGAREGSRTKGMRLQYTELPANWREWTFNEHPGLNALETFSRFHDYWVAQPGQKGVKADWLATWRNWCRKNTDGQTTQKNRKEGENGSKHKHGNFNTQDWNDGADGFNVVG